MPPRKTAVGIKNLIGKIISVESVYDSVKFTGKLVSSDENYLGIEVEDKGIFYFSKYVVRCLKEEVQDVSSVG